MADKLARTMRRGDVPMAAIISRVERDRVTCVDDGGGGGVETDDDDGIDFVSADEGVIVVSEDDDDEASSPQKAMPFWPSSLLS